MKLRTIIIALLLPLMAFSQEEENELQINGFIDTYHAVRMKSPNDFMSSRTRFRGELQKAFGKSSMFVSFNLNQNSLLKEQNGFELREAYFDYSTDNWSLRAGRQLIIWGSADGMRITDLVSPMDLTEFLARDYDDIRMPVEALKFNYYKGNMKLELVYVPVFKGFILPMNPKNPWAIPMIAPKGMELILQPEQKPDFTLKNSEFGGRLTFNLPGIDFSLATLHTYDKMPAFTKEIQANKIIVTPKYNRMTFVGGDFSKPLGQFVIRGEMAFNLNKHLITKQMPTQLQKHNTINSLLGIDWMTFNISKNLLNSTLKLSNFTYSDLDGGFFNRFSTDYSLSDQIHLLTGFDLFKGNKGMFSYYKDNSEMWIKAKYSF